MSWEKTAFDKLRRLGACVFLPTGDGKYLLQANDPPDKLRLPGGGTEASDKTLTTTIIRELKEELDLDPVQVRKHIKFLGYQKDDKYWGSAVYELRNHGLSPGWYQASNSPDEKIELVEGRLTDPRYTGPVRNDLMTEAEAEDEGELTKLAMDLTGELDKPIGYRVSDGKLVTLREAFAERPKLRPNMAEEDAAAARDEEISSQFTDRHNNPHLLNHLKQARHINETELKALAADTLPEYRNKLMLVSGALKSQQGGHGVVKGKCGHVISQCRCPKHEPDYEAITSCCPCSECWTPPTAEKQAKLRPIEERMKRLRARRGEDERGNPIIIMPEDEFILKSAGTGFRCPENWDELKSLSTSDYKVFSGANDWENCLTWAAIDMGTSDRTRRVWIELNPPQELVDGSRWEQKWGRDVLNKWIETARDNKRCRALELDMPSVSWKVEDFVEGAKSLKTLLKAHGEMTLEWEPVKRADESTPNKICDRCDLPFISHVKLIKPTADRLCEDCRKLEGKCEDGTKQAAVTAVPTTGPEAIAHALGQLDLDQEEAEAHDVIKRKLVSKRPDAVKKLGFIQGFRRSGMHPRDLVLHKVPVIPPQFRPFSVSGDVFIPGDANELYRDLINVAGVHKELERKLGPEAVKANKLRVYDAARAVYGFGDPVAPKTKERGVSGFLSKITGTSPKFGYVQRKLLSKDMDFVSRGVIGVDPELGLDEIGIPEDHAWKLYAPYIQRRLSRSGMKMADSLREVQSRSPSALKMLEAEMKERPVMYSRAPAWHKFNTLGAYPKLVKGSTIMVNPLVTTGLGADFDGDTCTVHLPSMPDAVHDVKHKLMPSKMLFSIKDPTKVVPVPKQEAILGLYSAQQRAPQQKYRFNSQDEALSAIRAGKIRMSDEVEFPGMNTAPPKPV